MSLYPSMHTALTTAAIRRLNGRAEAIPYACDAKPLTFITLYGTYMRGICNSGIHGNSNADKPSEAVLYKCKYAESYSQCNQ